MVVKILGGETYEEVKRDIDKEFGFHDAVSNKNCPHILNTWGHGYRIRSVAPQLGYIYMEYAPFGDLLNLIGELHSKPE
jgi:hypothetical protein